MSKTFIQLARLGDLINCLPILQAESQSTGAPARLMCCKEYAPLFGGTSYVSCLPFDGNDNELRRAYEQVKAAGDEPVSLQVIGDSASVKDLTYGPAGFQLAQTDSFQKEPYWLTANQSLWAKQPRPIFDGRSKAREALFFDKLQTRDISKCIFVARQGRSSAFGFGPVLLELLKGRFGGKFKIVDLSQYHGQRFYDFLGLLENAHCLVAVDSAFLHLAHACPDLPVCAMVNDKPGLWFGSAWRANHISHIRYSDFPFRAVEMLDAIEGIGADASWFGPRRRVIDYKETAIPRLIHTWSDYEVSEESRSRHDAAHTTWEGAYLDSRWISCPVEVGAFGRDSQHHNSITDEQRFPYVKDVVRLACYRAHEDDVIVLTRADACFNESLSEQLLKQRRVYSYIGPGGTPVALPDQEPRFELDLPTYSHRYYRENGKDTWHPQVDLFAFTKKWWQEHQSKYPDFFLAPDQYWNRVLLALIIDSGAREIPFGVYRAPSTLKVQSGPRQQYQERLHADYQSAHGEIVLAKPCVEQLPSVIVNRHALEAYAYNPSIVRWNDRLLMVFRYHDQRDFSTALAIAEINEQGYVLGRKPLQLQHVGGSEEDARFFMVGKELWLSYVDSTYPTMPSKAVVKYGKLVEDTVWSMPETFQPGVPANDMTACQKNFVMFEYGVTTVCIYQTSPKTVIYGLQRNDAQLLAEYEGPHWAYGAIRGGTTPLPYKGLLLRFFHSALDYEITPNRRRYFVGAMTMQVEPPFKPVAISKRPILWGSELDSLSAMERSGCSHYKTKVIFPLGAIDMGGGSFLLSAGINDSHCGLFTVTEKEFNL